MTTLDAVVIGAGPYGLGLGAHLRSCKGLDFRVFGDPMAFWRTKMPEGMYLRSDYGATHLWDPKHEHSLMAYEADTGNKVTTPVSRATFVEYALWFQKRAVPEVDPRTVECVERNGSGFVVRLGDGEVVKTKRVAVAAGIQNFASRPAVFAGLPVELVSHTADNLALTRMKGKNVIVIGAGQSALENAALLNENGAKVEVLVREPGLKWLGWRKKIKSLGPISKIFYSWTDVGPAGISNIVSQPGLLQSFPRDWQDYLRKRSTRPAAAGWLRERLEPVTLSFSKQASSVKEEGGKVRLKLSDGSDRLVDHVVLGTGYRVDIRKYPFLSPSLFGGIKMHEGFPMLQGAFETSLPGLHFLGAPATWTYGPLMNFVSGTKYASETMLRLFKRESNGR